MLQGFFGVDIKKYLFRRAHSVMPLSLIARPAAAQRRKRRSHRSGPRKVVAVGKATTGKTIYRGKGGGRYTRGRHGNKNYL